MSSDYSSPTSPIPGKHPTVVYIVSGTLTNHHDDGTMEEVHAGQAFAEFGPKSHWVENTEAAPATFVFTSLSPRQ